MTPERITQRPAANVIPVRVAEGLPGAGAEEVRVSGELAAEVPQRRHADDGARHRRHEGEERGRVRRPDVILPGKHLGVGGGVEVAPSGGRHIGNGELQVFERTPGEVPAVNLIVQTEYLGRKDEISLQK